MDTVAERWAQLEPHVHVFGPEDDRARPTVLLFHGCGGLRPHLPRYAEGAVEAGWRVVVVDSYAPRNWGREFTLAFVCTGLRFQGRERAADVLAAIWGVAQRPDVDAATVVLAGWSHGSWAIMDLMTMDVANAAEAGLRDAPTDALAGVKGLFLAYPYAGYPALSRNRAWRVRPRTLAVIARRDHVTSHWAANRLYERLREDGVEVETWSVDATHAFDEPTGIPPMRHDAELAAESIGRFQRFLQSIAPQAESAAA